MTAAYPNDIVITTVGQQLTLLSGSDRKFQRNPNTKSLYSVRVFYLYAVDVEGKKAALK